MAKRVFYIIQGNLQVFEQGRSPVADSPSFPDSDAGLREFDAYLSATASRPSLIVIDVIEEVFTTDSVPKLSAGDRQALLDRRIRRKFPRTPFRLSVVEPGKLLGGGAQKAVYSSISNHELLDPWLAVVRKHCVPLTGIYSVPVMTPKLLSKIYSGPLPVLFISQHQEDKIRQVFMQEGMVKSARLSKSPRIDEDGYPQSVLNEIQRSRRYLERSRLLSGEEQLDICMVTPAGIAERIVESAEGHTPMQFHFVEPSLALRKFGLDENSPPDRLESLFVRSAIAHRPGHSYAQSGENRYWVMGGMRRGIIAATMLAAAACSIFAGINFSHAWRLNRDSAHIDSQVRQLSETFRRENESFSMKAESYEMKLAVDTGDYILEQRVPVPWVMQQLGTVLGSYPDVKVGRLTWEAESAAAVQAVRPRPGEPPPPEPIPAVTMVSSELTASIVSFDGDMRGAFARIDELVADISENTSFSDTWVIQYPVDANVRSLVTGEISRDGAEADAQFVIRLSYPLQQTMGGEVADDEV